MVEVQGGPGMVLGVAYYPDYLNEKNPVYGDSRGLGIESSKDHIKRDLDRMAGLGLTLIRMGEFSWSTVEPSPGVFVGDLFYFTLDEALGRGIKVIFCTPTATPPKWLTDLYPETLIVDREGRTIPFGGRRHYDPLSHRYLEESLRITQLYARHFGQHPAVVGWQVDNEFGHHTSSRSYSKEAQKEFRIWLKNKYQTIEVLNREYFNGFWSMNYRDFDEIDPPWACFNPPQPHRELDYIRFMTFAYRRFQLKQIELLKKICPHTWVTHNFIPNFDELCLWEMTSDLDYVGYDHYQTKPLPDPMNSSVQFALMRSLKKGKKFFVLEQQPLQVNWQKHNRRFSPDWLFLWAFQAFFSGAEGLLYFSWQRFYGGAEQYHDGVRSHDVRVEQTPTEKMILCQREFFQVLHQNLGISHVGNIPVSVVVILDFASIWAHQILPQTEGFQFWSLLQDWLEPLVKRGIGYVFVPSLKAASDFIKQSRAKASSDQVRGILLPSYAFEFDQEERGLIRDFMDSGGFCVSMPRTGLKTKNNGMSPLPLAIFGDRDFCFVDYGAVSEDEDDSVALKENSLDEKGTSPGSGISLLKARVWAERIQLLNDKEWTIPASFSRGLYKGYPAMLQKKLPQGGCYTHFAFVPEKNSMGNRLLLNALGLGDLVSLDDLGEDSIIVSRWQDQEGRGCVSAFNFNHKSERLSLRPGEEFGSYIIASIDGEERLEWSLLDGLESLRSSRGTGELLLAGRHVLCGRPRGT